MPRFRHEIRLPFPPADVFAWHGRTGALERLAAPWLTVRVGARRGTIRDGDELELDVERGPVRFTWLLRHRDFRDGESFTDEQVRGPFQRWVHRHRFVPDGSGTRVVDEIEWEPPTAGAVEALATPKVERELGRVFEFRERRLAHDLTQHARWAARPRLAVAITGASGLIGTALTHVLTTGGHRVVPMVRSREAAARMPGSVYWNVEGDEIDAHALRGLDALVHLAGEPLVQLPRWTAEKRRRIKESRARGTELIARPLAALEDGPRTLVSASAVGYYGDRGDETLTEDAAFGRGFLAEVVCAWEGATQRAREAGLRVVLLRTGPVLSPAGGMLEKVLIPFGMGFGGRVGSGKQYISWIDHDDAVGVIYHALMDERMQGPTNVCAPNPVTNATFADVLGRVLGRPTLVPVPALVVKASLGEMGEETLLYSQRARPARLHAAGYSFRFEALEDSLRHQLGRAS